MISTRLKESEYEKIVKLKRESTCVTLSDLIRKLILNDAIPVRTRSQSIDDFLADMISLRKDLNEIANNFSRSVRRLRELESRSDIQQWILLNEQDKTRLFRQIEKINNRINEIHELCTRI